MGPPISFRDPPMPFNSFIMVSDSYGVIGPYAMCPLFAFICIPSQVASPEEPPRPSCFFWHQLAPQLVTPGVGFLLFLFIPYYPVPARDQA